MLQLFHKTFVDANNNPFVGYIAQIDESLSNQPARIYTSTGLLVSASGSTTTDATGSISVHSERETLFRYIV